MTLYSLLCQLMVHNSLLEQPTTVFTNTLKNINVYSGHNHFYTSILCVHQIVEFWKGASFLQKAAPTLADRMYNWRPVHKQTYLLFSVRYPTDSHPSPVHFLSFPALLRSWEAVHCRPHHLGHPLPTGSWLGLAVGRINKKTRGLEERDYGISFLLSPCSVLSLFHMWYFWQ